LEKDLVILKSRLKEFLGKEKEKEHWGREVSWNRNVTIPIPTNFIHRKRLEIDPEQKIQSIAESSGVVILDDDNDIVKVVLHVLDTGASKNDSPCLFSIELEPQQKEVKGKVRIILHDRSTSHPIPLYIENKGKGLCVYSVTQISAASSKVSRWYLHAGLNQEGRKKVKLIEKQIEKVQSDPSMTIEEKSERLKPLDNKMNYVRDKRQHQTLTVKTKGLLLYAVIESDKSIFNEIIWNLSRYNKYDEEDFDSYYDNGGLFLDARNKDLVRKMDYPFLLDYHKFGGVLPPDFAFSVLKEIAVELQSILEITSASMLKFKVTSQFFSEIRYNMWTPDFGISRIDCVNDNMFKILNNYHSVIGSYVRRKQKMLSSIDELKWNEEIKNNKARNEKLEGRPHM
jgi:hypothetical protein